MMTGEKWKEQEQFEAHGSTVVLVDTVSITACSRVEVMVEGTTLVTYGGRMMVRMYFWDDRKASVVRPFYERTFERGSCWRISGRIECEVCGEAVLVFIDPVYTPFTGQACEELRRLVAVQGGG